MPHPDQTFCDFKVTKDNLYVVQKLDLRFM